MASKSATSIHLLTLDTSPMQFKGLFDFESPKDLFIDFLNQLLNNKLTSIYLKMPKFNKSEAELVSHFDKWMYLLKDLNRFRDIPAVLQERTFRIVFTSAEVSNLNEDEIRKMIID